MTHSISPGCISSADRRAYIYTQVEVNPSLEEFGAPETIRAGCSLVRCALGDTLL